MCFMNETCMDEKDMYENPLFDSDDVKLHKRS